MIAALAAPAHWRCIEFISDLHLQAAMPATFSAWKRYLQQTQADALFILGDLFEVWIGDDILTGQDPRSQDSFESLCVALLRETSRRLPVFVMRGNRDFLLEDAFAQASGAQLLEDPCRLAAGGQQWLLSHGDALCLADTEYMSFRTKVRSPEWRHEFLAQPLERRQAVARQLRAQSEQRKRVTPAFIDLDHDQTLQWLKDSGAQTLIHGHTHQGIDHELGNGQKRVVLSDWDADAQPPRLEVLRMTLPGANEQPVHLSRSPLFAAT